MGQGQNFRRIERGMTNRQESIPPPARTIRERVAQALAAINASGERPERVTIRPSGRITIAIAGEQSTIGYAHMLAMLEVRK
jgi:hypothetical protein